MALSFCKIREAAQKVFDWCDDPPWGTGQDLDEQTLTPTVVDGETTAITISNGNTIPILHNHPPAPELDECDPNHLVRYAGFQGQVFPITATAFGQQELGWLPTAPFTVECDGFVYADFEQPWVRTAARDCFVQAYVDVRMLINGTPVDTSANYTLIEHWFREEVGENNNLDWRDHSFSWSSCRDVSAGDVVTIEHRYRPRITRNTGPNTYARLLVYRERATFLNFAAPVVVPSA